MDLIHPIWWDLLAIGIWIVFAFVVSEVLDAKWDRAAAEFFSRVWFGVFLCAFAYVLFLLLYLVLRFLA
ncbi:MAG: hypothetical protein JXD18_13345, partial [Anaerolineae bacterium]|nr:hypothetical protein [Anaerolineae bacterium]